MTTIEVFMLLQVLDFMTTLTGIRMGGAELSPFVRWLMEYDQVLGLAAVKGLGFALGAYCVWSRRMRVLNWVNYIFAVLVVWNVGNILRAVSLGM